MQARGLVVPVLLGIGMKRLFPVNSAWMMLAQIAVYTFIYAVSMWLVGMNDFEKSLITGIAGKLLPGKEKAGRKE